MRFLYSEGSPIEDLTAEPRYFFDPLNSLWSSNFVLRFDFNSHFRSDFAWCGFATFWRLVVILDALILL